jgi:hypothetical protein
MQINCSIGRSSKEAAPSTPRMQVSPSNTNCVLRIRRAFRPQCGGWAAAQVKGATQWNADDFFSL